VALCFGGLGGRPYYPMAATEGWVFANMYLPPKMTLVASVYIYINFQTRYIFEISFFNLYIFEILPAHFKALTQKLWFQSFDLDPLI
jgi:hypothetical protein